MRRKSCLADIALIVWVIIFVIVMIICSGVDTITNSLV